MYTLYNLLNVVKTIINQFGNGLYRLFMVKSEIVYYCFTMFYQHYPLVNVYIALENPPS